MSHNLEKKKNRKKTNSSLSPESFANPTYTTRKTQQNSHLQEPGDYPTPRSYKGEQRNHRVEFVAKLFFGSFYPYTRKGI